MNSQDLLALKAELTNDPLNLGLTLLAEDDVANADKLNALNPLILVDKTYVSVSEIVFDRDEYGGLSPSDRSWIDLTTRGGSLSPTKVRAGFQSIFGPNTATRAELDAAFVEQANRIRQLSSFGLLSAGIYNVTPSDVANARNAT